MKASSESGLCAMLISRTCDDGLPTECFVSCSEITVISNSQTANCCLSLRPALPARCNSSRHQHLDYFGKKEPVKPPAEGLGHRMSQHGQPGKPAGEKQNLAKQSSQRGARKSFSSMLHHKPGQPGDQRIRQQKSAGDAEHLCDPTRAAGTENRHAHRSFSEIQCERGKSA